MQINQGSQPGKGQVKVSIIESFSKDADPKVRVHSTHAPTRGDQPASQPSREEPLD